jgi:rhamnosyltransferase
LAPGSPRVWACVVCYRTTAAEIRPLVAVLESQVERVLLVDNSPDQPGGLATVGGSRVEYVPMPANSGTAGAMNEACRRAIGQGVDYVVSCDQDSLPGADLVAGLLASAAAFQGDGRRVAAVGPRKVDPRTGRDLRLLLPVRWRKRYAPATSTRAVEVDHLISSGCLVHIRAFQEVGPFNVGLFLDYVDIEWCLRARASGYLIVCDPSLAMTHVIGEGVIQIGTWSVWLHPPRRNGLLVRNHLLLWREPTVRASWIVSDFSYVLAKLAIHFVVAAGRRERMAWVWRGIRDGVKGTTGPM